MSSRHAVWMPSPGTMLTRKCISVVHASSVQRVRSQNSGMSVWKAAPFQMPMVGTWMSKIWPSMFLVPSRYWYS